jgi:hypothetical protein
MAELAAIRLPVAGSLYCFIDTHNRLSPTPAAGITHFGIFPGACYS